MRAAAGNGFKTSGITVCLPFYLQVSDLIPQEALLDAVEAVQSPFCKVWRCCREGILIVVFCASSLVLWHIFQTVRLPDRTITRSLRAA